jgi:hypothetical protein
MHVPILALQALLLKFHDHMSVLINGHHQPGVSLRSKQPVAKLVFFNQPELGFLAHCGRLYQPLSLLSAEQVDY